MNSKKMFFRVAVLGVLIALFFTGLSLLFLNRLSDMASSFQRENLLIFLAEDIEERLASEDFKKFPHSPNPLDAIARPPFGFEPPHGRPGASPRPGFNGPHWPPPPGDFPPFGDRPPFAGGPGGGGPDGAGRGPWHGPPPIYFWLLDENGRALFSSGGGTFPADWAKLKKPTAAHQVTEKSDFFRLQDPLHLVRLNTKQVLYLAARPSGRPPFSGILATQLALVFLAVSAAFFFTLFFLFLYLRKKSREARKVIARLAEGKLDARFQLRRFDEFGELLGDFNRMADQIEGLVNRLRDTEASRRKLLQELGHDLRTPLTSLRASVETLRLHGEKLSAEQQAELLGSMEEDGKYFGALIENLLLVFSLDEPSFKSENVPLNLPALFREEASENVEVLEPAQALPPVSGDHHLLHRLVTNALENATRYAKSKVQVRFLGEKGGVEIVVEDDGPGLSPEQIEAFGHRKAFGSRKATEGFGGSLGLGSVIMKSIIELHGGHLRIENRENRGGARLVLWMPAQAREED